MTIAEMRALVGLGDDASDLDAVTAYAAYLAQPVVAGDAPPPEPVTLEQAKAHLKVETDDEDDLIRGYLGAAIDHLDGPTGWLGRAIRQQTIVHYADAFADQFLDLPYPPIIEIISLEVRSAAGAWAFVPQDAWELDGATLRAAPQGWWPYPGVTSRGVRVTYIAGYDVLPFPIRAAILLMTEDLYRNRGTVTAGTKSRVPMSTTVENLLSTFRVIR